MFKNISKKPVEALKNYVDRIYIFEKTASDKFKLPAVPPGTGLELLLHLDQPLKVNQNNLPRLHSVCPRKMFYFDKNKKVSFISVRFKSGAFRHFSPVTFSELKDKFYSANSLWGVDGEILVEKLFTISTIENKIKEIEVFLIKVLNLYHNDKNDNWDMIIEDLYYNFDSNSIKRLAEKACLSMRQFERAFKFQFGITAKEFQKITRFQNVVKHLLLNKETKYLQTILDNGYFDQSHFIREFKSLTKKTPKAYFNEEHFNNHFYHTSMHGI